MLVSRFPQICPSFLSFPLPPSIWHVNAQTERIKPAYVLSTYIPANFRAAPKSFNPSGKILPNPASSLFSMHTIRKNKIDLHQKTTCTKVEKSLWSTSKVFHKSKGICKILMLSSVALLWMNLVLVSRGLERKSSWFYKQNTHLSNKKKKVNSNR